MTARRGNGGATLVELVVTIVVIGVGLAGVLLVMERATRASAGPLLEHQGVAVAEAYLDEVLLSAYTDPNGTEVGETRPTFDDVDDYNGLANNGCITTTPACPTLGSCACDQNGDPLSALRDYVVNVQVATTTLGGVTAQRVDVRVTNPLGVDMTLSGYRTNY